MESLRKGKKSDISWKNSRFTSWCKTPNKIYNLSYIVYCQVSRLFDSFYENYIAKNLPEGELDRVQDRYTEVVVQYEECTIRINDC